MGITDIKAEQLAENVSKPTSLTFTKDKVQRRSVNNVMEKRKEKLLVSCVILSL